MELPRDPVTEALVPGSLSMLLRPSTSKLHSLTHALELKENVKNVRPLRLLLSDEAAAQLERRAGVPHGS